MLQREAIETFMGGSALPWAGRLANGPHIDTHPHTLEEFAAWPQLDKIGRYHLAYLEAVSAALRGNRPDEWKQILAIGPFIGRKRKYGTIPLLFITRNTERAVNLHGLGEKLADPYLRYNILPDIHLLSEAGQQSLDQVHDAQWEETLRVSVRLLRS